MCWHLNAQRELTDKTSFLVKPVQSFKDEEWLTDMWKNKDFWHPGAPSCVDRCEKEDNIKGCVLVLYVLGSTFLKYRDGLMLVFEMRLTWNSMQWFPALKTVYILRFFIFSLFCEMTAVILNTFVAGYQVCRWVFFFFLNYDVPPYIWRFHGFRRSEGSCLIPGVFLKNKNDLPEVTNDPHSSPRSLQKAGFQLNHLNLLTT